MSLVLILIVTAVSLTVMLWVGTFLFQGYIYTEPSAGLYWQAPAAGALLTFGYTVWCLSIALAARASPSNIPIDTIFRFSPREEMLERPAPLIWAIKRDRKKTGADKDGAKVAYVSKRDGPKRFHYEDKSVAPRPWQGQDVIAIEIEKDDKTTLRFDLVKVEEEEYRRFVSSDGWVIHEFENGPTGLPIKFRLGRLIWNLIFNFGHLIGWFLGLWVLLRFQWSHALGLAVVLWLVFTLIVLPMLLGYAGEVAVSRSVRTALAGQPAAGGVAGHASRATPQAVFGESL